MEETTFAADPMRLMIAAAVGIVCRDCFIQYLLMQFYGFSCISDFWSQGIGYL